MKKKYLIKTLIILVVLGFLAKFLSMIARILMTRIIGVEGMGLFSLANPCMLLVINLAQLGLPTAIATKVAKEPQNSKKIFVSGLSISVVVSIILMISTYFLTPFLAVQILKNDRLTMTFYALALLIPLVSLSALIKGYFIGQNEMKLTSLSTVMEEVGRIFFILIFLDYFASKSPEYASFGAMLGVCVGEIFQSLYLIFFNERHLYRRINEILSIKRLQIIEKSHEILSISIPITLSRLIGSITYFFEPIILTNMMIKYSFTTQEITYGYGILNGYVMPLLLMPGFFTVAFSNFLLPNLSRLIANNRIIEARKTFFKVMLLSLGIGITMAITFTFFSKPLMMILYGMSEGHNYVSLLSFPFIVYYFESPLISAMHALDLTKKAFILTLISCIIRLISLTLLIKHFNVLAVCISTLISVYFIVICELYLVLRKLFFNNKQTIFAEKS